MSNAPVAARDHGAGDDRDPERAPADRTPARAELTQQAAAHLPFQPLHRRHGDEDERDRPADPDDRRQQVHDAQRGVHARDSLGEGERRARPADRRRRDADARPARQRDRAREDAARARPRRAADRRASGRRPRAGARRRARPEPGTHLAPERRRCDP